MKIAIISDSHDNVYNIEKFLDWSDKNKIEMIIHCGDLAASAILKNEFGPKFKEPFHFVHGNVADRELNEKVAKDFPQMTCHGDVGQVVVSSPPSQGGARGGLPASSATPPNLPLGRGGAIKIGFCHHPDQAKIMAESGEYDLVFYGHNHKPWMETLQNGCQLINPGTLGGLFNKSTFSVYDTETKNLELKIVEQL